MFGLIRQEDGSREFALRQALGAQVTLELRNPGPHARSLSRHSSPSPSTATPHPELSQYSWRCVGTGSQEVLGQRCHRQVKERYFGPEGGGIDDSPDSHPRRKCGCRLARLRNPQPASPGLAGCEKKSAPAQRSPRKTPKATAIVTLVCKPVMQGSALNPTTPALTRLGSEHTHH